MRRRSRLARWIRVSIVGALAACGETESRSAASSASVARLVRVDTLAESESLFVGRPRRATFTPDGNLLVTDQVARRVVDYDRTGAVRRVIGRPGEGPGEFSGPVAIALWGADTLAVTDTPTQSVSLFRLQSGEFIARIAGLGVPTSLAASGSRLFVAAFSMGQNAAAAVLHAGDASMRGVMPLPPEVLANPLAMRAYPATFASARADSVAVVFIASNHVFISAADDPGVVKVAIPHRARRSIPHPLDPALAAVVNGPERMTFIPSLDGVHWRADGLILVWHKDWLAPVSGFKNPAGAVSEATLRVFATVLDRAQSRACVDIAVPADWAENPAFFADDAALFALGHALSDEGATTRLELRKFELPLEDCDWVPLSR